MYYRKLGRDRFLKDLQHELNNQETDCQAAPIYYMTKKKTITI